MTRAPDWSEEEFRLLLSHPDMPALELVTDLPQRTVAAIELVRQGVADFQKKGESVLLSQMMVRVLNSG
jgi:hypothetical protein